MGREAEIPTKAWTDAFEELAREVYRRLEARGRPLTDEELVRNQPLLDALERGKSGAMSHTTPTLSASVLAAELVSLPDYPRRQVTQHLFSRLEVDDGVAFCRALIDGHGNALDILLISACFEWLSAQRPRDVVRLLTRWTLEGVLPRWPPGALAQSLGFPLVGDLRAAAEAHEKDPSADTAAHALELMGIEHSHTRYRSRTTPERAPALWATPRTSLDALAAAPDDAVVVDLSGTKLRELPDVLLRCRAMKHLALEDDYFDDAEKRAIEARLHWVKIRWTQGRYIDGQYGR